MSRVLIRQKHTKSDDEVRAIIADVQDTLRTRYDLKTRWRGEDAVEFQRPGLSGELSMEPGCVVIRMKLGIMLGLYARTIQTELENTVADKLAEGQT
jgi:putative polyhydroxyalkanoate system protein